MNYSKVYYQIIENRLKDPFYGYVEKHHIVPKSFGGTDDNINIVKLTAREHFICHLLLTKMFSENTPKYFKMVKAFMMMLVCKSENQQRFLTSKKYELLKTKFSEAMSIAQSGHNNSQFGVIRSQEVRNKIRDSLTKTLAAKGLGAKKKQREKIKLETQTKLKREQDLLREYYLLYDKVGFTNFVMQTGYNKSRPNLVQRFKKLLPEFKPQPGKKRGKKIIIPRKASSVHAPAC